MPRQEDEIGEDDEICFCLDSDLELNSTVVTIDNVHLMLECFFEDDTHYAGNIKIQQILTITVSVHCLFILILF